MQPDQPADSTSHRGTSLLSAAQLKETIGPASVDAALPAKEEPEICASFASMHTSILDSASTVQANGATRGSLTNGTLQKPTQEPSSEERIVQSSPIPLSKLFDFDKESPGSDHLVLNHSEKQTSSRLKTEPSSSEDEVANASSRMQAENGSPRANGSAYEKSGLEDASDEELDVGDEDGGNLSLQRRGSYEEMGSRPSSVPPPPPPPPAHTGPPSVKHLPDVTEEAQTLYSHMEHNIYKGPNTGNSPVDDCLPCQCKYNPARDPRWKACGPDCINRNLLVECIEDDCPCGSYCLNRRFQMKDNAKVDVIKTESKGYGLRSQEDLPPGTFVMEYIGEVLTHSSFVKRTREYSLAGMQHFYFMSLQADEVIDATKKGCLARFINHSCNPNCHLEKWVVGSKLRIGIFTIKRVAQGEELTFDYQFERYGAEAQKCHCGEPNCTGFIGGNKRSLARFDNYAMDEEEDADEIELENEMSLRVPKKERGYDGDYYVDPYEERRPPQGIEDPMLMEKLARIMFMKPKVQKSKRLLAKLVATDDRACLRRFLVLHGLVILKAWLRHYKDEPDIVMGIMFVLPKIPLLSRNAIEDSQIEEAVQEVADGPECPSKELAIRVLDGWKDLKATYRIPKAKKQPVAQPGTEAVSTPSEEPSSFVSPAESNGSGSMESNGKRQYEDDDRSSTPVGAEKRGKYEIPVQGGADGASSSMMEVTPQQQPPAHPLQQHTHHPHHQHSSPDYYLRQEHGYRSLDGYRSGDPYGRDGRVEYGRDRDPYGRMDPYGREMYGRAGDSPYGRGDPFGREMYSRSEMAKMGGGSTSGGDGYERGRYDPYRSDRERERDRYHEYYRDRDYRDRERDRDRERERERERDRDREREREWEREYRMREIREPRDARDLRDLPPPRDARGSSMRDLRDARDSRGTSPHNRSRITSPREYGGRSVSPVSRQGSWSGAAAGAPRSYSPTKAGVGSSGAESGPVSAPALVGGHSVTEVGAETKPLKLVEGADALKQEPSLSSPPPPSSASAQSAVPAEPAAGAWPDASIPTGPAAGPSASGYSSRYSYSSRYPHEHSHYSHYSHSSHHRYSRQPLYRDLGRHGTDLPHPWRKASDQEGRIYYYNEITRATQWEYPRIEPPEGANPVAGGGGVSASGPSANAGLGAAGVPSAAPAPLPTVASTSMESTSLLHEAPKPVNIDGFTQDQLQEVIGRAFDKLKRKNQANSSTHGSPSARDSMDLGSSSRTDPRSPSAAPTRTHHRHAKPMTEKDLKNAISAYVVKSMAKFKIKLGTSEAFKKHARRITHLIAEKETRSKQFSAGELTEITPSIKSKIRKFVQDYMTKLFKKAKEDKAAKAAAAAAAAGSSVLGGGHGGPHVIVAGASLLMSPPPNAFGVLRSSQSQHHGALHQQGLVQLRQSSTSSSLSTTSSSVVVSDGLKGSTVVPSYHFQVASEPLKSLNYGDVDVEDDDDVKYGEGADDDDEDHDDDDEAGVAAVPSSSVELQL